jgi:hypothetical protein
MMEWKARQRQEFGMVLPPPGLSSASGELPKDLGDEGSRVGYGLGVPPASSSRVLSLRDSSPERGSGRLNSQSAKSKNSGVRLQQRRHAPFAARRVPSLRATRPAYAGCFLGTSDGLIQVSGTTTTAGDS